MQGLGRALVACMCARYALLHTPMNLCITKPTHMLHPLSFRVSYRLLTPTPTSLSNAGPGVNEHGSAGLNPKAQNLQPIKHLSL